MFKKKNTSELSSQNSELTKQNKDLQEEVGRLIKKIEEVQKEYQKLLEEVKEYEKEYHKITESHYEISKEIIKLKEKIVSLEEIHKFSKVETLKYNYNEAENMLNCGWKVKHVAIRHKGGPLFVLSPPDEEINTIEGWGGLPLEAFDLK